MPDDLYGRWWRTARSAFGSHSVTAARERQGARRRVLPRLKSVASGHYVAPAITASRLADLGAPKTARIFREELPVTARARAGDLGEILATEYATRQMGFTVPVYRLRWKDGRDMALRGDDLIGFLRESGRVVFLKGEVKSRKSLTATVLNDATTALDRGRGRPTRHSVIFVANQLRTAGDNATALLFEKLLLEGPSRRYKFAHLVFTMSGNSPTALLHAAAARRDASPPAAFVGFEVPDYPEFIQKVFELLNAP